jgi:hypothetical protein
MTKTKRRTVMDATTRKINTLLAKYNLYSMKFFSNYMLFTDEEDLVTEKGYYTSSRKFIHTGAANKSELLYFLEHEDMDYLTYRVYKEKGMIQIVKPTIDPSIARNIIEQYKKASPITGTKFIIGKTKDEPIAYIKNEEGLTMDSYWEIRKEAEELGLGNFPIHIHATVNGGPNGSKTYTFTQTY